jgi:hypothetical protein
LKGTEESIKTEYKASSSFDMEDYENFPEDVTKIMEKYGDDDVAITKALKKAGYEVDTDMDGSVNSFKKK